MKSVSFLLFSVLCFCVTAQQSVTPLSNDAINTIVEKHLRSTDTTFDWNQTDIHTLWSAIVNSDSLVVIGYQTSADNFLQSLKTYDRSQADWQAAKEKIVSTIKDFNFEKYGDKYPSDYFDLVYDNTYLPNILIRAFDVELLEQLRIMKGIRYLEVANFDFIAQEEKSNLGCSDYSSSVDAADFTPITPQSVQSWVHLEHQVDAAWLKCNHGDNVTVAVFDSGLSATNPKLNADFTEGESGGRTISKLGFYPPSSPDGWQDQCGHGTAMSGLIAAPRGYNDTPAGMAYKSNLISYRVTNDVVINASDEYNALANALTDATNNTAAKIASISLGDVISHGPVTTAVQLANSNGMLIFAAAGTSLCATSWYPVIFPAWMPETVAVTGAIEGTTFTRCCECHDGNEVDFTIYMERAGSGDDAVTTTMDNTNSFYRGYVGGSSSATASMAGICALVWGNNPNLNNNQILDRMIQSSSAYPIRDSDFGWGAINACSAVDTTFNLPCASSISNSVTLEINAITFPSTSDNLFDNTAEWVVKIDNNSYYFEVSTDGATGNPSSYNNPAYCDPTPIIIDLGNSVCGQSSINVLIETFEDDFGNNDCNFDTGDDDQNISTQAVNFSQNTFTSPGGFSFSYTLYCTPTLLASISNDSPACYGTNVTFNASPAGMDNYDFFIDSNANDLIDVGESLQSGPNAVFVNNALVNQDVIGVVVTDSDGCTNLSTTTVLISPANLAGPNQLTGTENGIADYETDGIIESVQIIGATAVVDYDSQTEINLYQGFETMLGAEFMAFIDGCNGGSGGLNFKESSTSDKQDR